MEGRFHTLFVSGLVAAAMSLAMPALAQDPVEPPTAEPPKPIEPPSNLPRVQRGDPLQNLDRLFQALKVAPDAESAKYIENRIWSVWFSAGGDTGNLLMTRVKTAVDGKDIDLAIKLLTAIIDIRPD